MSRGIIGASVLLLVCVVPVCAQSTDLPPALRLLAQVTQKYADSENYYIRAVERETSSGKFDGSWTKRILIAAEVGRRFHFEIQTGNGSAVAIADGNTVWLRHVGERSYVSMSESDKEIQNTIHVFNENQQIKPARSLRTSLVNLANEAAEVSFLPDSSLPENDRLVRCKVILLREGKQGNASQDSSREKAVWIDEDGKILKVVETQSIPARAGTRAREIEITTTFTTAFDSELPDCLFTVEPLDVVSDGANSGGSQVVKPRSLVGKQFPGLRFNSADAPAITVDSLAGKPLLIDFWATWCAPCVASLPELAEIYDEAGGKGLLFVAIDEDKDGDKASSFLQKRGYTWPDFNDPDAGAHRRLGYGGVPHVVLVNSQGMIVYDGTGEDVRELRSRIAQLGAEFRSLAPESTTCALPGVESQREDQH